MEKKILEKIRGALIRVIRDTNITYIFFYIKSLKKRKKGRERREGIG